MIAKLIESRSKSPIVALALVLALLWGCGDAPQASPTPRGAAPTATTAAPATATAVPLATNTVRAAATSTRAARATPTTRARATATVGGVGELLLRNYSSESLEFNFKYPGDWQVDETPDQQNPETAGRVQFTDPQSNGNTAMIVSSLLTERVVSSAEVLTSAVGGIKNNAQFSNVTERPGTMQMGKVGAESVHLEYDWSGLRMAADIAATVQGKRAYTVLSVAPLQQYEQNRAFFEAGFNSFEPTAATGDFESYTTPNGAMTLLKPRTWPADTTNPDFTIISSPDEAAMIILAAEDARKVFTGDELNNFIDQFMTRNFASTEGYKLNSTEQQPDGSVRVSFDIQGPNDAPWRGNGFFEQRGTIVGVTLFTADYEKWESFRDTFGTIANSITINQGAIGGPVPTPAGAQPIVTERYDNPNVQFTMLAPAGWSSQANDDGTIAYWTSPDGDGTILIQVQNAEGMGTDFFQDPANAVDYVTSVYGDEPDFKMGNTAAQPDGSMRVGWTMTGPNARPWQGEGFLEVRAAAQPKMIVQLVSSDVAVWDIYEDGFNAIVNSLQLR